MLHLLALAPLMLATPLATQLPSPAAPQLPSGTSVTAPTPDASDPSFNLTDKEKSTLTRCNRLTEQERAQSSKCSAVMKKAGKGDPASKRPATPNVVQG